MRDYWLTHYLLATVGWGYLVGWLAVLLLALGLPRTNLSKFLALLIVLAVGSILPIKGYHKYEEERRAADAVRQKTDRARAVFEERCRSAGEKIYRTASGVSGFRLLRLRPEGLNRADQFALTDPYGADYSGQGYIESMLWGRNPEGRILSTATERTSYRYVLYRPSGSDEWLQAQLEPDSRAPGGVRLDVFPARAAPVYGVTFEDISTPLDRESWIAGSRLLVLDTRTGEVLAEREGWMMDPGQGDQSGGRAPWLMAASHACPAFPTVNGGYTNQLGQTRDFVEKVLKP